MTNRDFLATELLAEGNHLSNRVSNVEVTVHTEAQSLEKRSFLCLGGERGVVYNVHAISESWRDS